MIKNSIYANHQSSAFSKTKDAIRENTRYNPNTSRMASLDHISVLSAVAPFWGEIIWHRLIVRPPLRSSDVFGCGTYYKRSCIAAIRTFGDSLPCTNPYPIGPRKLAHSEATLSHDHSNIWTITSEEPSGLIMYLSVPQIRSALVFRTLATTRPPAVYNFSVLVR